MRIVKIIKGTYKNKGKPNPNTFERLILKLMGKKRYYYLDYSISNNIRLMKEDI